MNRILVLVFVLSLFAGVAFHGDAYAKPKGGKILTAACIMSYTDLLSKTVRVVRSEPLVIALR